MFDNPYIAIFWMLIFPIAAPLSLVAVVVGVIRYREDDTPSTYHDHLRSCVVKGQCGLADDAMHVAKERAWWKIARHGRSAVVAIWWLENVTWVVTSGDKTPPGKIAKRIFNWYTEGFVP